MTDILDLVIIGYIVSLSPQFNVEVLMPSTLENDFIWEQGHYRCNNFSWNWAMLE